MLESALALRPSVHPTPARDLTELTLRLEALKAQSADASPEVQSLVERLEALVSTAAAPTQVDA